MASNIVVPEVGESIVDARIAKWLRREGDAVAAGDPLVELETDKIDLEVSAPQAGVLARIARQDGEDVKVGEVLGVIEDAGRRCERASSSRGSCCGASPLPAVRRPPARRRGGSDPGAAGRQPGKGPRATPTARKAARGTAGRSVERARQRRCRAGHAPRRRAGGARLGRTRHTSAATGPGGAPAATPLSRRQLRAAATPAASKVAAPVAEKPRTAAGDRTEERVRMSKRRATIARRLVEAQSTAAMLTTFNEVDMSAVMALRERHKQSFKERHGVGLGIASFFVKASIGALRAFPRINAEIQGDEMVLKHYYDIGVAVGASEGLVVPVLRDADRLELRRDRRRRSASLPRRPRTARCRSPT